MVGGKSWIRLLDLAGQEVILDATKDKEEIRFISRNKAGELEESIVLSSISGSQRITLNINGTTIQVEDGKVWIEGVEVHLGAENADDDAVLDSKLQTELGGISSVVGDIKGTHNSHYHTLLQYIVPMMPLAAAPCLPGALPDSTGKPFVPSTDSYSPGDTHSDTVKVQS